MLLQLFIKNIALIDQIELSFGKGLHVMTVKRALASPSWWTP